MKQSLRPPGPFQWTWRTQAVQRSDPENRFHRRRTSGFAFAVTFVCLSEYDGVLVATVPVRCTTIHSDPIWRWHRFAGVVSLGHPWHKAYEQSRQDKPFDRLTARERERVSERERPSLPSFGLFVDDDEDKGCIAGCYLSLLDKHVYINGVKKREKERKGHETLSAPHPDHAKRKKAKPKGLHPVSLVFLLLSLFIVFCACLCLCVVVGITPVSMQLLHPTTHSVTYPTHGQSLVRTAPGRIRRGR